MCLWLRLCSYNVQIWQKCFLSTENLIYITQKSYLSNAFFKSVWLIIWSTVKNKWFSNVKVLLFSGEERVWNDIKHWKSKIWQEPTDDANINIDKLQRWRNQRWQYRGTNRWLKKLAKLFEYFKIRLD